VRGAWVWQRGVSVSRAAFQARGRATPDSMVAAVFHSTRQNEWNVIGKREE
jgi:hypothetical protein